MYLEDTRNIRPKFCFLQNKENNWNANDVLGNGLLSVDLHFSFINKTMHYRTFWDRTRFPE